MAGGKVIKQKHILIRRFPLDAQSDGALFFV